MQEVSPERIPDFQTLMFPVLQFLKDQQPHTKTELIEHLAKAYQLSDEELRIKVQSGQQYLFDNRVTWAVSYLKMSGLLSYLQRGVYQITPAGIEAMNTTGRDINLAFLKSQPEYKKHQESITAEEKKPEPMLSVKQESETPDEKLGSLFSSINEKLEVELLQTIKERSPSQFEKFVLELLSRLGYGGAEDKNFEVVGQSGDNGIDGIIYQDKLGIDRIYVQAKRWADNKVQSKDIRDFIGSLSLKGTNKGIFITTSQFTTDATRTVQMNPQNIIILIDGRKIAELAIKFNVGVQVKEVYEVKNIDQGFFEEL